MASQPEPPEPSHPARLVPALEPSPALLRRSDYRLVRTLLSLQHTKTSGALRVDAEGVLTVVYVRDGQPVFVEGGLPADSLGRLLVARGTITEATLAQVEEQRMLMQGRLRFGDVARRMGVLEAEALKEALRDQVRDKLARCLHWERSQHVFIPMQPAIAPLEGAALQVEPLLWTGITRHFSLERAREMLTPFWHEAPELSSSSLYLAKCFELADEARAALESIDGRRSIRELLAARSAHDTLLAHLLVALALCDQLKLPEAVAPEESGPFSIEDLPRLSRRPGEEPSEAGKNGRPPAVLREVANLPGKEKLLADSAFLQGKELLRAGEYGAAADAFREASNLRPSALEYALFAAWSAYLSTGRAVKWRDMLVELCERTLEQDRHLAFGHHVRGQLALETKDLATARDSLRRALELDPQDEEARRLLARLSN
jgi:thioredoxin-like negative regulator of GroEL